MFFENKGSSERLRRNCPDVSYEAKAGIERFLIFESLHNSRPWLVTTGTCTPRGDLGLYGQANKRTRWMPWRSEAKKDVAACEKCRGAGNKL